MRFKRGPLSQRIPQVFGRCQPSGHVDLLPSGSSNSAQIGSGLQFTRGDTLIPCVGINRLRSTGSQ